MSYRSQVVLVVTEDVDRCLRSAIDGVEPEPLRSGLSDLFDRRALRIASPRHAQVLYFWDWMPWRRTGDVAVWLDSTLGDLPSSSYQLRVLGERDGDDRVDGELEDAFRLAIRRFIDLDPESDSLFHPRSAYERLLDCARALAAAYERGARDGHIEWADVDDAHRLSGPALRFLVGK